MARSTAPTLRRRRRFVAALVAALVLAATLAYTSFTAASSAVTPSQLLGSPQGRSYQLTGRVAAGSVRRNGDRLDFAVHDRSGGAAVAVRYAGIVPDPFRVGREVVVTGRWQSGRFDADRDSLVTKCPSKFSNAPGTGRAASR